MFATENEGKKRKGLCRLTTAEPMHLHQSPLCAT